MIHKMTGWSIREKRSHLAKHSDKKTTGWHWEVEVQSLNLIFWLVINCHPGLLAVTSVKILPNYLWLPFYGSIWMEKLFFPKVRVELYNISWCIMVMWDHYTLCIYPLDGMVMILLCNLEIRALFKTKDDICSK